MNTPNADMNTPLLSLCIPTWNRAPRLALLIENIRREIVGLEGLVEVVVADNASSDSTGELVAASSLPITYGRQDGPVRVTKNILFATCALARGKFVWIIGDDDLIAPGGLKRIVDSLIQAPELDYHYVNFSAIDVDYRDKVIQCMNGIPPVSALQIRQCDDLEWKILDKAEDLVFLSGYNPSSLFTSLFCYVAKRSFYEEAKARLRPTNSPYRPSNSLDDVFPQALITLPNIIGRPIAYIGQPCILQGTNSWEWQEYLSWVSIFVLHKLLDWMESIGFDRRALGKMRDSQARTVATKLPPMLLNPENNRGMDAGLRNVIADYTKVPDFWEIFSKRMTTRIETDFIAQEIARFLLASDHRERGKFGVIGDRTFREKVLKIVPTLRGRLSWIAFNDGSLTGQVVKDGTLSQTHDHHLRDQDIDTLVLAMRREEAQSLQATCAAYVKPGTHLVSACGTTLTDRT